MRVISMDTLNIPLLHAEWECISKFAFTFNGYERHGSLEACAIKSI